MHWKEHIINKKIIFENDIPFVIMKEKYLYIRKKEKIYCLFQGFIRLFGRLKSILFQLN